MNGIYLTNRLEIIEQAKQFIFREDINYELGEILTYKENDIWYIGSNKFFVINKSTIRYLYIEHYLRGNGLGKELLIIAENKIFEKNNEVKIVCKTELKDFYTNQGYEIKKEFINYLNLIKWKPFTRN
jgi:hypothetical protein